MEYLNSHIRYVAYFRVSTQKQERSGLGLEAQRAAINAFCGPHLIGEFVEIESGAKTQRRELAKAIQLCQKEKALLIAHRLDRVLRNLEIVVSLRINKVSFTALDCLNDSDMIVNFKASLAEEELRKVSERTKAALQQKKAQGYQLGKPENLTPKAIAKGQQIRQLNARQDENNRRAGTLARSLRKAGHSWTHIVQELNSNGFRTRRGKPFRVMQVQRVVDLLNTPIEELSEQREIRS